MMLLSGLPCNLVWRDSIAGRSVISPLVRKEGQVIISRAQQEEEEMCCMIPIIGECLKDEGQPADIGVLMV